VKRFKEGRFESLMRWEQLASFWENLKPQIDDSWYVYAIGEDAPEQPSSQQHVLNFIDEIVRIFGLSLDIKYFFYPFRLFFTL